LVQSILQQGNIDMKHFTDSPVEQERKAGPNGGGDWPGFPAVYRKISQAAEAMGQSSNRLNDFHVSTMADLGSGHEERMKYRLSLLRVYGWV
jgi:hypothetical protein